MPKMAIVLANFATGKLWYYKRQKLPKGNTSFRQRRQAAATGDKPYSGKAAPAPALRSASAPLHAIRSRWPFLPLAADRSPPLVGIYGLLGGG